MQESSESSIQALSGHLSRKLLLRNNGIGSGALIISVLLLAGITSAITWNYYNHTEAEKQIVNLKRLYGVNIHRVYKSETFFPYDTTRRGSQIWLMNLRPTLALVRDFLSKYPTWVINKNLSDIFLLDTLEIHGKKAGGTYIGSKIYISTGGIPRHSDDALLALMHAEFSSILFHKYNFPRNEWESISPSGWKYLGNAFDVLGSAAVYEQSLQLFENGFLNGYSQASLEEDFNSFVSWTFTNPTRLRIKAESHKRIKEKCLLIIKFFELIDPKIEIPKSILELRKQSDEKG